MVPIESSQDKSIDVIIENLENDYQVERKALKKYEKTLEEAFKVKKFGKYVLSEIIDNREKSTSFLNSPRGDETFETQLYGDNSPRIKFEAYKSGQLI